MLVVGDDESAFLVLWRESGMGVFSLLTWVVCDSDVFERLAR